METSGQLAARNRTKVRPRSFRRFRAGAISELRRPEAKSLRRGNDPFSTHRQSAV